MEAVLTLQCAQDPLYYLKYIANEAFIEGRKEKKKKEKKKACLCPFFPLLRKKQRCPLNQAHRRGYQWVALRRHVAGMPPPALATTSDSAWNLGSKLPMDKKTNVSL